MKSPALAWHRHLWVWVVPAAFCLLGSLGLLLYQSSFAGRVEVLEADQASALADLEQIQTEYRDLERFLETAKLGRTGIGDLYADHFSTEPRRLTTAIAEIKRLARQAGLEPSSFAYPSDAVGRYGLQRRGVTFSVEGTYGELRTFINFLELTEQFFILESVRLGSAATGSRDPQALDQPPFVDHLRDRRSGSAGSGKR